jgi:hypothetical protein
MSKINKELFRSGAVICGSALFGSILFSAQALAATQEGEAVKLGNGTAQVVVTTDEDRNPVSIAVSMTAGAFDGLPTELNKDTPEGSWEFPLPMPEGSNTGYKEVVIDWNPHGHPPPEIYTVPHFDFRKGPHPARLSGSTGYCSQHDGRPRHRHQGTRIQRQAICGDFHLRVRQRQAHLSGTHGHACLPEGETRGKIPRQSAGKI